MGEQTPGTGVRDKTGRGALRTTLTIKWHALLERYFPERRLFLKSDTDTRFIRLRPGTQIMALVGSSAIVGWAIIATAILIMDSIGAGNFRDQAERDQRTYEERLSALSKERDMRAEEALAAQERFNSALERISAMQTELLASETRRRELETGVDVIQNTLRTAMKERDAARLKATELAESLAGEGEGLANGDMLDGGTLDFMIAALQDTALERDKITENAQEALQSAKDMAQELALIRDRNEQIFRELEEAMTISVEPLEKMFSAAGLNTNSLLNTVRQGYSGHGGPLTPLSFSTRGSGSDPDAERANELLNQMDRLNLYRIAAEKAPFAVPLKDAFRFTSGFGMRWGRMHNGADFAAPHGTAIYSTADGVVTFAGWQGGYGRLIKIQHEFGIETRYAHLSRIRVNQGQRVSRGERIGDMGNTGRTTGTHLHYEVRVGGKPVNPMTYIKAAKDVF